jgi:glycine cleavage system H protein
MRPDDAKYSETHEWVRWNEKKKEATIGITDYAVQQLSDLVHIDLNPKEGDAIEAGAPFGEIESVKTVADLISPITGKVIAVNQKLLENVDVLKEDAFDEGWMIRIKVDSAKDLEELMSAKEYKEFLASLDEGGGAGAKSEEDVDEDDIM